MALPGTVSKYFEFITVSMLELRNSRHEANGENITKMRGRNTNSPFTHNA